MTVDCLTCQCACHWSRGAKCDSPECASYETNRWTFAIGDRVKFVSTGAEGSVIGSHMHDGPYAGDDVAGEWTTVQFDDGLRCANPTNLLESIPPEHPSAYDVTATVTWQVGRWTRTEQVPAFTINAATQGIVSEKHAEGIARRIINPTGRDDITVSVTAVAR